MKSKKLGISLILCYAFFITPVSAANIYCTGLKSTFRFVGEIVRIIKIAIPLIIIAYGALDLLKVVTASKDGELTKSLKSLLMRLLCGICIFFLPSIIEFIFLLIDEWGNYESGYEECITCILDVSKCETPENPASESEEEKIIPL